jgi:hypothetical protein
MAKALQASYSSKALKEVEALVLSGFALLERTP